MKKPKIDSLIDTYFIAPIIFDALISTILILLNTYLPIIPFKPLEKSQQLNILSNLIGTTVSLAGFILAALTIIVTFKSSLKAKGFNDSETALEYFFSTNHYKNIVSGFKRSIEELVIIFILLYVLWLSSENTSTTVIGNILLACTIGTITAILRSLYILFSILSLEFLKKG